VDDALATWLALREPHDWAARDASLVDAVVRALPAVSTLRIVDLGTGTGSNFRYLAPRLPARQEWLLVDKSPDVVEWIVAATEAWAAHHALRVTEEADGFRLRGPALDCQVRIAGQDLNLPLPASLFEGRELVTAAALLDLVSDRWLRDVASHCAAHRAAALFALTYDGQSAFEPSDPDDDLARDLLNAHQLRDKGLGGPAEGPRAHARAVHWFREVGFETRESATPWQVPESSRDFQRELIGGLAGAAVEQDPGVASRIGGWRTRRLDHLDAGRSRAMVGHHDLAAWPRR
jgi:SAM-dependent methyltransferase